MIFFVEWQGYLIFDTSNKSRRKKGKKLIIPGGIIKGNTVVLDLEIFKTTNAIKVIDYQGYQDFQGIKSIKAFKAIND